MACDAEEMAVATTMLTTIAEMKAITESARPMIAIALPPLRRIRDTTAQTMLAMAKANATKFTSGMKLKIRASAPRTKAMIASVEVGGLKLVARAEVPPYHYAVVFEGAAG